jgi:hypothetical protein
MADGLRRRPIFTQRFLERHAPALLERENSAEPVASTSAKPAFDPDAPLADDHVSSFAPL